jgi:hypothetical protein
MESLSQDDSSANSSDPDDELGPEYINESGLARILGRVTDYPEVMPRSRLLTTRARSLSAVSEAPYE